MQHACKLQPTKPKPSIMPLITTSLTEVALLCMSFIKVYWLIENTQKPTFDVYELLLGQRLSVHRVRPILCDVLLDQPAFKHLVGHRRDARVLWHFIRNCKRVQFRLFNTT